MESLEHICRVMSCGVDDILDFVYETGEQNEIH
jgi:DNA-binding Xre family transcriptional regulator